MSIDMESRLRQALQARAAQMEPDAGTWQLVQARLRRSRQRRLALAGAAAVAALVVVAFGVPSLLGGGVIRLDGEAPVADQPDAPSAGEDAREHLDDPPGTVAAPEPGRDGEPGIGLEACHTPATIAAVLSAEGDLLVACANGQVMPLTEGAATDRRPAITPEGDAVVFERTEPGQEHPVLVYREFAEDADEVTFGGGALPALAPDGRLARVLDAGDGTAVVHIGEVFSEPEFEATVDYAARDIVSLQWDPDGERLLYGVATEAGLAVWTFEPRSGHYQAVLAGEAGFHAVAFGPDGTLAALREAPEGTMEVVALHPAALSGGEVRATHTIVEEVPGVDPRSAPVFLAPGGFLRVEAARSSLLAWARADEPSWFVGDAADLYLVDASGRAVLVPGGAAGAATNAAVQLGESAHSGVETGGTEGVDLPEAVESTRRRLVAAAAAGDLEGVRDVMAPEFSYSFGAEPDREGALAHFEANPESLGRLAEVLDTPHGVVEQPDGALYVWPRAHARESGEWTEEDVEILRSLGAGEQQIEAWRSGEGYTGLRAGIRADGTWLFWIAGD